MYLEAVRRKLEDVALQYAQCKNMGFYMENGNRVYPCSTDRTMMAEMFLGNLGRAAEDLLAELSSAPLPERKVD
jgi:hypothetical protein